jgi:S1-C subfamily serine protease
VADSENDSCAGRAGIRRDDVVVSVAGTAAKDAAHLISLVANRNPGDKVEIRERRGESDVDVVVALSAGGK